MKNFVTTCILIFFIVGSLQAQSGGKELLPNIVPNPSFENYSSSPIGWFYKGKHFTEVMKYWSSCTTASPDVFGPRVRVPAHWQAKGFGDQRPFHGKSMAGITCYGCLEGKPHCREYIQIQLKEPLVPGQNYYMEFWVSHLPRSLQINNIGACFSVDKINEPTDQMLPLTPQVRAKKVISAPYKKWQKISSRFQASSQANYLIIGNFFPDSLTQVRRSRSDNLNYAYYYLDKVSVRKEKPIIEITVSEDDLSRIEIAEGKIIQLKNIFFETDRYELLPRSYIELNKLIKIMRENPKMIIEVRGHTDIRGELNYNIYLSRKRAKAVVEYLNQNNISPRRTHYKGFGSSEPIASNDNEEGWQLNRRVEFLIIKK